jgi:hypothetical protein
MMVVANSPIINLHQGFSTVVLLYTAAVALWGLFLYFRGRNPSANFLGALAIDQGVVTIQSLIGVILLITGHRPGDNLHYLYGVAAVLTLPTAYLMSNGGRERRDSGLFGLGAVFLVFIAIRAIMTGATS